MNSPTKKAVASALNQTGPSMAAHPRSTERSKRTKAVFSPARAGRKSASDSRKRENETDRSNGEQNRPDREMQSGELDAKQVLQALAALKRGDFSARLPVEWTGVAGKVADEFNCVEELLGGSTEELSRVSRVVGQEGRISERLSSGQVTGAWQQRVDSVNTLITCLVHPISETARVIGAVAKGDLSQSMAMEIAGRRMEGEVLRTAKTVDTMVSQLGAVASEGTRVAREVGTEGKLGGQAEVKGVAGTGKNVTDNVNLMAGNLTSQVRNIAAVTTAIANGD